MLCVFAWNITVGHDSARTYLCVPDLLGVDVADAPDVRAGRVSMNDKLMQRARCTPEHNLRANSAGYYLMMARLTATTMQREQSAATLTLTQMVGFRLASLPVRLAPAGAPRHHKATPGGRGPGLPTVHGQARERAPSPKQRSCASGGKEHGWL